MFHRALFLSLSIILYTGAYADSFSTRLSEAAKERTHHHVTYNGSYRRIDYPLGDVPNHIGVCTDVVIRSYRALGIDLQVLVHEDMKAEFEAYPSNRIWGLTRPDTNIDHRRVPNLQSFFSRNGMELEISSESRDYLPGNIVTWMLGGSVPHIGIVVNEKSPYTGNYMIVHNVGEGPKMEDVLFRYQITGHYRFEPET